MGKDGQTDRGLVSNSLIGRKFCGVQMPTDITLLRVT